LAARSPIPALGAGISALAAWLLAAWRANAIDRDLVRIDAWLSVQATAFVKVIASIAGAIAILYGSFSASGADASGYLSHAAMLARGDLTRAEPLTAVADWPNALQTLAPLGWRAAFEPGRQVPTYPVGLPLLMAPAHALGSPLAACLITPLSLLVAVWATGSLALRVGGPGAGVIAAVWLATSPIALIAAMQPMSDIVATAAWLVCWLVLVSQSTSVVGRQPLVAGLASALAILIRPNLAPLASVPALFLFLNERHLRLSTRARRLAVFCAPIALAVVVIGWLQWRWFGSPLRSGHGTAQELFAVENFASNIVVYSRWLLETHGPWLFVAPLAFLWPRVPALRWLLVFAAAVCFAYLVYGVFEVWTYLRFLLPALAIGMIAVGATLSTLLGRLPMTKRGPVLVIIVVAIAAANVASSRAHDVFRFGEQQSRAMLAGRYLEAGVPVNAVILAGEQSGAIGYYTGRSIVRWDLAARDSLDAIVTRLRHARYDVWFALDEWEEELFRVKFASASAATLDWPPVVDAGTTMRTRAWRLRDRERFLRGDRVLTDRLR